MLTPVAWTAVITVATTLAHNLPTHIRKIRRISYPPQSPAAYTPSFHPSIFPFSALGLQPILLPCYSHNLLHTCTPRSLKHIKQTTPLLHLLILPPPCFWVSRTQLLSSQCLAIRLSPSCSLNCLFYPSRRSADFLGRLLPRTRPNLPVDNIKHRQ